MNFIVIVNLFQLSTSVLFIDPRTSFSLFYYTLKSMFSVRNYSKRGYKIFIPASSKNKKKTRTLFLLGSGQSINEITKNQWNYIKSTESWGFNNWNIHDFIPNSYFVQSEFFSEKHINMFYEKDSFMKDILLEKKNQYSDVEFYVRGDNVNNYTFHKSQFGETLLSNNFNKSFISELIIRSKSKIRPIVLMNKMFKLGFFSTNPNNSPIPKFGNTITELISLALIMGFKKIVLCGIDMNDNGHFYDKDIYSKRYELLNKLNVYSSKSKIHPHADKTQLKYTTKDVIKDLNIFSKQKFNAEIFVSSTTSSLYPEIKKYKF